MSQQHRSRLGAAASIGGMAAATPALALEREDVTEAATVALGAVQDGVSAGYRLAPALMLGLAVLVVLPVLAVACRVRQLLTLRRSAPQTADKRPVTVEVVRACLERIDAPQFPVVIATDMVRIGREDDNDICSRDEAVHGYHAAIYRDADGSYRIADLSGDDDSVGVRVNGEPCEEAALADGDLIEFGRERLRFRAQMM